MRQFKMIDTDTIHGEQIFKLIRENDHDVTVEDKNGQVLIFDKSEVEEIL
ncbi:hypothetical protein [Exiguobacterium sp. CinTr1]|nr:hypothetical protein [Exiguobacterium sp. CinTr1]